MAQDARAGDFEDVAVRVLDEVDAGAHVLQRDRVEGLLLLPSKDARQRVFRMPEGMDGEGNVVTVERFEVREP